MSSVVSAKDDCGVQQSSDLIPWPKALGWLLVLGGLCLFIGAAARAQNLDQGKSGPRLFADSCAACHRSARGLAKGRFRLTLFMYLKDHYATSSGTAWELASYLESADIPSRGRSRSAAASRPPPATPAAGPAIRPPLPVPLQ
jgi:mono/diheme cytochrome c family protein